MRRNPSATARINGAVVLSRLMEDHMVDVRMYKNDMEQKMSIWPNTEHIPVYATS